MKKLVAASLAALLLAAGGARAQQGEIKVGEINSYSALPAFLDPYRKGMDLALKEVNDAGGIKGKKLVIISKDDGGKPADALTAANELVSRDGVVMIAGGFLSNVGLALADFAKQKQVMYLAAEPLTDALVWSKGNDYTFRLRTSNYMQAAMLAEEAAKLPAKRWATIAPNYEFGQSFVAVFKELLKKRKPDVEFVAEQWPPLNKIDAGPVLQAIDAANPEAILNATFAGDLVKLVREGNTRGIFKNRVVVSYLTGEPEYLDPLKTETPEGWIVTGYPWYGIKTAEHQAFLDAYQQLHKDYPRLGSIVGYSTVKSIAAALKATDDYSTAGLVKAMKNLKVSTPFGDVVYRAADHQSTMGAYIGTTSQKDGQGIMVNFQFKPGADYLPSEAEAAKLRPAN
ncbi:branched-chain amino acid transport system substrate-binding protein [Xanthobacter flavus]|nr:MULTISPECIES: ABC transporter substrate-binding protein [Xanthobacter]MBN8917810.1 ABC transporter substrate-binding protein [Hyphomicrobiales bacterium]MDR6332216.1 branched-chain amino acid transport system substrate-binding protein [Xanthobacter flavus]NMN56501.1 branched-chain amino acid transport system substrate-binding protein [Xanthobacter sp. SG618]